ncbi:unnamed protein product [Miscanthus lutarioriparius]|uniref:Uncharacterized protein n=1 Tax=Miscanthus lutarioriparius TaxID=422564 RepID=A0A811PW28_9POAL|nr:unnamed protein product [Miscanthus lutarioriparius]
MGPKLWASGVYSRPRWSEEEDERVLAVASAVALGRSGGAHIVGRGVVARRRQAVKGPMECERGHECSGECYRAGGLGTDGSIKRRMGIERARGWMRGRSPWCRFRQVKDAEWKWNCGRGGQSPEQILDRQPGVGVHNQAIRPYPTVNRNMTLLFGQLKEQKQVVNLYLRQNECDGNGTSSTVTVHLCLVG